MKIMKCIYPSSDFKSSFKLSKQPSTFRSYCDDHEINYGYCYTSVVMTSLCCCCVLVSLSEFVSFVKVLYVMSE
jgi:hypothetical protein